MGIFSVFFFLIDKNNLLIEVIPENSEKRVKLSDFFFHLF